jgi:hypothetical protein
MKVTVEIKFFLRPVNGQKFAFTYYVNGDTVLQVTKSFKDSAPGVDEILIGANATLTAENVLLHLQANNMIAGMVYTRVGTSVFASYDNAGDIMVTDLVDTQDYFSVYVQDAEVMGMPPVNMYSISIEIIDTYDNTRPLIEEYTQPSAPKLVWDGGDDLYQALMTSSLKFNMAVLDAADAKFLHLLSGDEKRYLVKVKNTDTHDNIILLWQGFILPDLYSEPWKNGVPFIEYTAIDMLASLKTKTFDSWYYEQRYSLPELLGLILKETGLLQEMYIRPMMINVLHADFEWRDTNISLETFRDDKKLTNLYDVLEKVLTAQGMTIYSFRGKWFIEGLTRRCEGKSAATQKPIVEVYHPDGVFKEKIGLGHKVVAPLFMEDLPVVDAETPWKRVNMDFAAEAEDGLFSQEVGKLDYFSTRYRYDSDFADYMYGFVSGLNAMWQKVNAPGFIWSDGKYPFFNYGFENPGYVGTEAFALSNYFECIQQPYAVAGRRYKLEIDVNLRLGNTLVLNPAAFQEKLTNGDWDSVLLFLLKINGTEFISNRPGNIINKLVQFSKNIAPSRFNNTATFRLDYEFVMPQSGFIQFSFLAPIGNFHDMFLSNFTARVDVLKITLVKNPSETESISAVRPINFTKELDVSLDFTCSVDDSIKNSFGIGRRISKRFYSVPVVDLTPIYDTHYQVLDQDVFDPIDGTHGFEKTIVAAYLELSQWKIEPFTRDLLFKAGLTASMFMVRADGTSIEYPSVYVREYLGQAYITAYNGFIAPPPGFTYPHIPETDPELPVPESGDKIYIMLSLYPEENKNLRAKWKIYGYPDESADSYINTLAKACHDIRPDVCFGLEATALDLITPNQLVSFRYNNQNRVFISTRLELDLTEGKTQLTMKEALLTNVNDISYD